jgi:hypothetical protein
MAHTANHSDPESGKFRCAVVVVWASLQAMDFTTFDYTLDCIERLEGRRDGCKRNCAKAGTRRQAMPTSKRVTMYI